MVRPARPDEREALEALQRRASLVHETYREALLTHPDAIDLPAGQISEGRVRVAEEEGRAIGFAALMAVQDGACDLDGLFTEPEAWGRGVARALIDECQRMARAEGAKAITVTANPDAIGFYQRVGFAESGRIGTRFGEAITMCLVLEP